MCKVTHSHTFHTCSYFSRCTEREFGQKQWQTLRTKLAAWQVKYKTAILDLCNIVNDYVIITCVLVVFVQDNITNVISTIQANKVTEESTQASLGTRGLTVR